MKLVKNLVFAGLLVFAMTFTTFAGEQDTPTEEQKPKLVATPIDEGTDPKIDPYTGEITTETTDYLFFEALAALLSVY
jgi:hypothetical protein